MVFFFKTSVDKVIEEMTLILLKGLHYLSGTGVKITYMCLLEIPTESVVEQTTFAESQHLDHFKDFNQILSIGFMEYCKEFNNSIVCTLGN